MGYKVIRHSGVGHDEDPPGRGSGRYPWGSGKRPHQNDYDKNLAAKTQTWVGNADKTFDFLASEVYYNLTNYGRTRPNKDLSIFKLPKLFRKAFGDNEAAQREALKLLYSSEVTRFMDEESSFPSSSDVFNRYKSEKIRSERNEDLSVGDQWGTEQADEWKSYMEKNVNHKIPSLTNEEKAQALLETKLGYDEDDYNYIKKSLKHSDIDETISRICNKKLN